MKLMQLKNPGALSPSVKDAFIFINQNSIAIVS